jgi:hypothetical protein
MARRPTIDTNLVHKAQEIVSSTRRADTIRLCQSVLLPAFMGASLEQTAAVLGVSRATIYPKFGS